MRPIVTLLALCGVLMVARADAAGLSLTWDRCATNAGATSDITFDCADPSAVHLLFAVFNSAVTVSDMIGIDFTLDLRVDAATLPTFWQLQTPLTPTP
jgi:hypothetical protein